MTNVLMKSFVVSAVTMGLIAGSVKAQFVFTTNINGNSSSMVDCSSNKRVATYPVGGKPEGIAVNHVLNKVYIPGINTNTISVINPCNSKLEFTITNVIREPCAIAVSPDGRRFYVSSYSSKIVQVYDANTYAILANIPVGSHPYISAPFGIIVSPDNSRVYVGLFDEDKIAVINALTNTVITYYATDNRVTGMDISRDGSRLYVANQNGNTLIVFNTSTGNRVATIRLGPRADPYGVGGAVGVTLNYANTRAYVTIQDSSTVKVINLLTNTVIKTIPVGGHPFGIDIVPNDSRVYVSCIDFNQLAVINTSTNSVIKRISVGERPYSFGKFIIKKNIDSIVIDKKEISCNVFNFFGRIYGNQTTSIRWQWDFGDNKKSSLQNPTHTYTRLATFPVTLVATDINGCKTRTTEIINPSVMKADAGPGDTICAPGSATLQASVSGATRYSWKPATYLNDPLSLNPIATPPHSTTFYLTATNSAGCTQTDSVRIGVRPKNVFLINSAIDLEKNKTANLKASGGDIYTWSPAGSLSNASIANPVASPDTTTIYQVIITDTVCDHSAALFTTVTVLPETLSSVLTNETKILPEKREKYLQQTITVYNDSITILLYDNGIVDGDSITLVYNDKLIVSHILLSEKPVTLVVGIDKERNNNELQMFADNLGSIPPNTALMIIWDGDKRYSVSITSDKNKNGAVSFVWNKKKISTSQ